MSDRLDFSRELFCNLGLFSVDIFDVNINYFGDSFCSAFYNEKVLKSKISNIHYDTISEFFKRMILSLSGLSGNFYIDLETYEKVYLGLCIPIMRIGYCFLEKLIGYFESLFKNIFRKMDESDLCFENEIDMIYFLSSFLSSICHMIDLASDKIQKNIRISRISGDIANLINSLTNIAIELHCFFNNHDEEIIKINTYGFISNYKYISSVFNDLMEYINCVKSAILPYFRIQFHSELQRNLVNKLSTISYDIFSSLFVSMIITRSSPQDFANCIESHLNISSTLFSINKYILLFFQTRESFNSTKETLDRSFILMEKEMMTIAHGLIKIDNYLHNDQFQMISNNFSKSLETLYSISPCLDNILSQISYSNACTTFLNSKQLLMSNSIISDHLEKIFDLFLYSNTENCTYEIIENQQKNLFSIIIPFINDFVTSNLMIKSKLLLMVNLIEKSSKDLKYNFNEELSRARYSLSLVELFYVFIDLNGNEFPTKAQTKMIIEVSSFLVHIIEFVNKELPELLEGFIPLLDLSNPCVRIYSSICELYKGIVIEFSEFMSINKFEEHHKLLHYISLSFKIHPILLSMSFSLEKDSIPMYIFPLYEKIDHFTSIIPQLNFVFVKLLNSIAYLVSFSLFENIQMLNDTIHHASALSGIDSSPLIPLLEYMMSFVSSHHVDFSGIFTPSDFHFSNIRSYECIYKTFDDLIPWITLIIKDQCWSLHYLSSNFINLQYFLQFFSNTKFFNAFSMDLVTENIIGIFLLHDIHEVTNTYKMINSCLSNEDSFNIDLIIKFSNIIDQLCYDIEYVNDSSAFIEYLRAKKAELSNSLNVLSSNDSLNGIIKDIVESCGIFEEVCGKMSDSILETFSWKKLDYFVDISGVSLKPNYFTEDSTKFSDIRLDIESPSYSVFNANVPIFNENIYTIVYETKISPPSNRLIRYYPTLKWNRFVKTDDIFIVIPFESKSIIQFSPIKQYQISIQATYSSSTAPNIENTESTCIDNGTQCDTIISQIPNHDATVEMNPNEIIDKQSISPDTISQVSDCKIDGVEVLAEDLVQETDQGKPESSNFDSNNNDLLHIIESEIISDIDTENDTNEKNISFQNDEALFNVQNNNEPVFAFPGLPDLPLINPEIGDEKSQNNGFIGKGLSDSTLPNSILIENDTSKPQDPFYDLPTLPILSSLSDFSVPTEFYSPISEDHNDNLPSLPDLNTLPKLTSPFSSHTSKDHNDNLPSLPDLNTLPKLTSPFSSHTSKDLNDNLPSLPDLNTLPKLTSPFSSHTSKDLNDNLPSLPDLNTLPKHASPFSSHTSKDLNDDLPPLPDLNTLPKLTSPFSSHTSKDLNDDLPPLPDLNTLPKLTSPFSSHTSKGFVDQSHSKLFSSSFSSTSSQETIIISDLPSIKEEVSVFVIASDDENQEQFSDDNECMLEEEENSFDNRIGIASTLSSMKTKLLIIDELCHQIVNHSYQQDLINTLFSTTLSIEETFINLKQQY